MAAKKKKKASPRTTAADGLYPPLRAYRIARLKVSAVH
jgi:hypothetical protein